MEKLMELWDFKGGIVVFNVDVLTHIHGENLDGNASLDFFITPMQKAHYTGSVLEIVWGPGW